MVAAELWRFHKVYLGKNRLIVKMYVGIVRRYLFLLKISSAAAYNYSQVVQKVRL